MSNPPLETPTARKVKISIQTNFQINAAVLTATAANPAPSRSIQRSQPQRPGYMTQAPCPASLNALQPLKPLCGDSSAAVHPASGGIQLRFPPTTPPRA